MAQSTQLTLALGGASLVTTLTVLLVGSAQPACSFSGWLVPGVLALQLCFAFAAGFATSYLPSDERHPVKAGLRTNLIASLSGFILYGLAAIGFLPAACSKGTAGLGVFFLIVVLVFFIAPVAIFGGAAAGWFGGLVARKIGRVV
jgi:hypothetical protein